MRFLAYMKRENESGHVPGRTHDHQRAPLSHVSWASLMAWWACLVDALAVKIVRTEFRESVPAGDDAKPGRPTTGSVDVFSTWHYGVHRHGLPHTPLPGLILGAAGGGP